MARFRESACYGCAECIQCSRKHRTIIVYECDDCKEQSVFEEFLTSYKGKELCFDCLSKLEEQEDEEDE